MMDPKLPALKMIYQFNLDSHIPKDHFLRLVESAVNFSFVRDLARRFYSDRGAPSVDPVVLDRRGIRANIPPRTTHVTATRKKEEAGFHYDADRDMWVCPEGKTLYKMSQSKPLGHTLYMVSAYACRKCPRHGARC